MMRYVSKTKYDNKDFYLTKIKTKSDYINLYLPIGFEQIKRIRDKESKKFKKVLFFPVYHTSLRTPTKYGLPIKGYVVINNKIDLFAVKKQNHHLLLLKKNDDSTKVELPDDVSIVNEIKADNLVLLEVISEKTTFVKIRKKDKTFNVKLYGKTKDSDFESGELNTIFRWYSIK